MRLGLCSSKMITGILPFNGRSVELLGRQHSQNRPASIVSSVHHRYSKLAKRVDEIVQRCLMKEPASRFQTVAELRMAIQTGPGSTYAASRAQARAIATGRSDLSRSADCLGWCAGKPDPRPRVGSRGKFASRYAGSPPSPDWRQAAHQRRPYGRSSPWVDPFLPVALFRHEFGGVGGVGGVIAGAAGAMAGVPPLEGADPVARMPHHRFLAAPDRYRFPVSSSRWVH